MRNALLIAAAASALLAAGWFWLGESQRSSSRATPQPSAAKPPVPSAPVAPASAPPPPAAPVSAADLTARARSQLERDPAAALSDIEHADRLAGARDEQRRALEIVAWVRLGRVGHARALADQFYRAFPASAEIQQLERLTGYHPRPYRP